MPYYLDFDVVIDRPIAIVYAHLAQPKNFLGLQPLLTSMSPIQEEIINGHTVYRYETVETFRFGPLPPYNNRIRVQTNLTEPNRQIDTIVQSNPKILMDVCYQFEAQAGGTHINEQITFQMPSWISRFVLRQATQVQHQTLANLKQRLESA